MTEFEGKAAPITGATSHLGATAKRLADAYTAAWNTGRPDAVAAFFAADGAIIINKGNTWQGHAGVAEMAAGFFADIPDLSLTCDEARGAGDHLVYVWTFTGTHAATGNAVRVAGWEEWDLGEGGLIKLSRGWFDADDYARQTAPKQAGRGGST